jgi:peptide/nickel transport system substrate-binding protein
MFTTTMTQPDPQVFMEQYTTEQISQKANKWSSRNISRWRSEEYDKTFALVQTELDPVKRAAHFIKLNDLVCSDNYIIPVVFRPRVSAAGSGTTTQLSGWDNDTWAIAYWHKEATG